MRPIWGPGPKPSLIQLYLTVARESIYYGYSKTQTLPGYGSWHYVESTMNRFLGESAPHWGRFSHPQISSRGVGGPSESPTSTAASVTTPKRASESRKRFKAQSAHGFRKTKGVSARGKCPKGHYWSHKDKKCVKSKFR